MDMPSGKMCDMSAGHMHMHDGMMGDMAANHGASLIENLNSFFGLFGRLAAEILITLTSGPVLHFLAALVLLLAGAVLLRILLARRAPRP